MLRSVGRCDPQVLVAEEGDCSGGLAILQFSFVATAFLCVEVECFARYFLTRLGVDDRGCRPVGCIDEFVAFPAQLPALRAELRGVLAAEVEFLEGEEFLSKEVAGRGEHEEQE